ncbi:MAG: RidA family protein [Bacteroidetes bacterium]|nr:RidA family protein [Bacteroidota bacterium]
MSDRINISSGAKWESIIGYSRAVRVGNVVEVSGTTASTPEGIHGKDNVYEQSVFIFKKIEVALAEAGASLANVVRTRMYVTDISQWEGIAKAHEQFFGNIKPASSMVEVSALIHPDMLIEIEVTAII